LRGFFVQRWKQPWSEKQLRKDFKESLVIKAPRSVEGIKALVKKLNHLRDGAEAASARVGHENKKGRR
jgi:P2-related tail formation protein